MLMNKLNVMKKILLCFLSSGFFVHSVNAQLSKWQKGFLVDEYIFD